MSAPAQKHSPGHWRAAIVPVLLTLAVGGWVLGGGLLGDDPWRVQTVASFKNDSAQVARVLALYPDASDWVPVFHGPTHWTSDQGRMQAASGDPSLAWIIPGGESAMDLFDPARVAGCLFVVQRRDVSGAVAEAGRVAIDFVPGRWTELSLDADGSLQVRHGWMSSGFGLRPEVLWGQPRGVAQEAADEANRFVPSLEPPLPGA